MARSMSTTPRFHVTGGWKNGRNKRSWTTTIVIRSKVTVHNAEVPRDWWLRRMGEQAILDYHDRHPLEGYRRLAFMMLDDDVMAVKCQFDGQSNCLIVWLRDCLSVIQVPVPLLFCPCRVTNE